MKHVKCSIVYFGNYLLSKFRLNKMLQIKAIVHSSKGKRKKIKKKEKNYN